MRKLIQLVPMERGLVGWFENGDRVQELFAVKPICAVNDALKDMPPKMFAVWDPLKNDWVDFETFQRSGP